MRILPALLIAAGLAAPQPAQLSARFIGNMSFAITDGTTTVMTDFPYQSGYSGYMTYPASEIRSDTAQTISLITHRHADHWESALFARTNWKVIGPRDVVSSVAADRRLDPGEIVKGVLRVEPVATPHAGIGHDSYLVTWHGRRLWFTGDTESLDALTTTKNLDVAFVSPWLWASALKRGLTIDAKRIVIYHHPAGETVAQCTGRCTVPRQGDVLRF
jgi:L-ascorbate metabolism protein UlaG (beta-lactamase superfamily)